MHRLNYFATWIRFSKDFRENSQCSGHCRVKLHDDQDITKFDSFDGDLEKEYEGEEAVAIQVSMFKRFLEVDNNINTKCCCYNELHIMLQPP